MGYIFETEIDAIKNTVRSMTIGESESIELREVLQSSIHPAVKAYFKAEVIRLLDGERGKEHRSNRFPYAHPEVVSLQQQLDLLLISHYQFTQSDFESLLDEAVHFQFNYLCRPQWTLVSFIMGEQRRVATSVVERKLRYCVDYTYFVDLVSRYIAERGLIEISFEEFKTLLQNIDREVVARHSSLELARMLRALFSFVDAAKLVPHDQFDQPTLPTNAAIVFFEDKQLTDIRIRLEFERDRNKVAQLSILDLANLVEKVRTHNEDAAVEITGVDLHIEESAPQASEEQGSSDELGPDAPGHGSIRSAEASGQSGMLPDDGASPPHVAGGDATTPANDLGELIPDGERRVLVRSLFSKDETVYEAALEELNACPTWEEASHCLDDLFVRLDADPYSESAVKLTDIVYSRYVPRPRG